MTPCLLCWVTHGTLGQIESKLALFTGKQATVALARRREPQAEAQASLHSNIYCAVHSVKPLLTLRVLEEPLLCTQTGGCDAAFLGIAVPAGFASRSCRRMVALPPAMLEGPLFRPHNFAAAYMSRTGSFNQSACPLDKPCSYQAWLCAAAAGCFDAAAGHAGGAAVPAARLGGRVHEPDGRV